MTRLGVLLTVIAALVVFAPPAPAQLRIEIPKPGGEGVPIAISPLSNPDSHAEQQIGETFARTIARDLTLSGLFRVLDRRAYIEGPEGFVLDRINFQRLVSLRTRYALVKGGFWLNGEQLTIEARLFDVTQQKQLGGRRYLGHKRDVRRMAHRFADQIMLFLTGEEGPFNSNIAFISNRVDGRSQGSLCDRPERKRSAPGHTGQDAEPRTELESNRGRSLVYFVQAGRTPFV